MSSPSANWNVTTIDGVEYLVITTAQFRVPLDWDPSSNMFIAVAAPNAAVPIGTGGFPALLKGDPGPTTTISDIINFTPLAAADTTPASASFTPIGTNQVQLNLALHEGQQGPPGDTPLMTNSDLAGAALPGRILIVNAAGNGFIYGPQRVGDRYVPATIASVPAGNPTYTLCAVPVPSQPFDWRPEVSGAVPISPTGLDLTVDVVARLSNTNTDGGETTGNEVGRAIGLPAGSWLTGPTPYTLSLESGPPPGSPDSWDRVPAGQIATVFFRIERQSGINTFTTNGTTSRFKVQVKPCPSDLGAVTPAPPVTGLPGPLIVTITAAGAFTQTPPSWATIVDVVTLGDGGGGGAGLAGGGHPGTGTSATVGAATLTSVGGAAAASGNSTALNATGLSPGSYSYAANTYTGGAAAPATHVGYAPGGGGGGGQNGALYGWGGGAGQWASQTYTLTGISTITGTVGGGGAGNGAFGSANGAPGAVWLNFRSY